VNIYAAPATAGLYVVLAVPDDEGTVRGEDPTSVVDELVS
jgi:hypothetical protein